MNARDLPLFELFTRLQEAGLPLGLNEYAQVIQAIQAGFGISDKASLARLCKALWVKTEDEAYVFKYHFDKVFKEGLSEQPNVPLSYVGSENPNNPVLPNIANLLQSIIIRRVVIGVFTGVVFLTIGLAGRRLYQLIGTQAGVESTSNKTDSRDNKNAFPLAISLGASFTIILLGGGVAWLLIKNSASDEDESSDSSATTKKTNLSSTSKLELTGHQAQAKLALANARPAVSYESGISSISTTTKADYFPIKKRKLQQSWRYLRCNRREGPKLELDIAGTVQQIGRHGFLVKPVRQATRLNRTDLILLLDQDGSMVPFQSMGRQLIHTAARAGHLPSSNVYYFHNCPRGYLYHDPFTRQPEPLFRFLTQRLSPTSVVMIFSDAGAARRNLNPDRVQKTRDFLEPLTRYARRVVWLNPIPAERWHSTTAEPISKLVSMFETKPTAFKLAIDVLRGQKLADSLF